MVRVKQWRAADGAIKGVYTGIDYSYYIIVSGMEHIVNIVYFVDGG